jgi:hypothetical protein
MGSDCTEKYSVSIQRGSVSKARTKAKGGEQVVRGEDGERDGERD